jgi:hypothetical protein
MHVCNDGELKFAMEVEDVTNNPYAVFQKQKSGALGPLITAGIIALMVAALLTWTLVKHPTVAAPNGYFAVDFAYQDGKLVRPFMIDANVDHATCVDEDSKVAAKLLESPDAPPGVSIVAQCIPMPAAPAAAPKAAVADPSNTVTL